MAKSKAAPKQKSKQRFGKQNGRWKGGVVLQNGYPKKRDPDSPHADSSGYAYVHRTAVNAPPGTQVHHKDENRKNASKGNLKIEKDLAAHNKERKGKSKRRKPKGE